MQRASDALYLGTGRRRLTTAECAVLQDFPADHPFQGGIGAQYRQIGNAVPVPLGRAIGQALVATATQTATVRVKRMRGTSVHKRVTGAWQSQENEE